MQALDQTWTYMGFARPFKKWSEKLPNLFCERRVANTRPIFGQSSPLPNLPFSSDFKLDSLEGFFEVLLGLIAIQKVANRISREQAKDE